MSEIGSQVAGKRRCATRRVTVREEVPVMEVYWQLILRTGCARFAGHDTLPSRLATGKPTRDVLHRRTESNLRPSAAPDSRPVDLGLFRLPCQGPSLSSLSVQSWLLDVPDVLRVAVDIVETLRDRAGQVH